ncbi:MAG: beta-ketoacyl synthase [Bacteroidales bacterium]|nr:beta-ketoacyl synthase [Bacteroidales bacterium]
MPPRVYCIGKSIVTPLGNDVAAVFNAVREGRSALRLYPQAFPGTEPVFASLFPLEGREDRSLFQEICLEAARKAVADAGADVASPRTALVLCSVKGEIEALGRADVTLAASARKLADALGVVTPPLVVSNACISGLAGLIEGRRLLLSGLYDTVLVVGAEVQSRFIVSGFQSLKALSEEACKPFDAARKGLNLGEAAAAMVLSTERPAASDNYFSGRCPKNQFSEANTNPTRSYGVWEILEGVIRNDANHISGPSRTGEGSYNAMQAVLPCVEREELAFVSVHGTSTLYNDEMESIALDRAGLTDLPVSALKGTFGHTMGAAGILETILGMEAVEAGIALPTRGFENLGVSRSIRVSATEVPVRGNAFVKLLSGFGGVNGACVFKKSEGR